MTKPLYYTFGNHMHWVDMQWLWGYEVLPSSIRDMLALVRATGARGNVNFDGVGYEKLAAEDPEALGELRAALAAGEVEVVGASYGQPYGLFQGGESNVRQRVYGVRTALRVLGVRPRAFWEEEFDFFPQLPQLLAGCGYTGASLFYQWTWHTPTIPEEELALVRWRGLDGTELPALPKNALCLHQWPEDFEGRLDGPLAQALERPAVVQWVELLPSPDWMCRSEVLLPRLHELFADERFDVRPVTLSGLVEALSADGGLEAAPVRAYTLDDVFHGMSLGKNGDRVPRASRACEEQLLAAESISALAGLFGRPYPHWDVYPTWELEEGWRELLAAQHHDNHECEGLCGFVGELSFERSMGLSEEVYARTIEHFARRVSGPDGALLVHNPCGWTRDVPYDEGVARDVPAFGYTVVDPYDDAPPPLGDVTVDVEGPLLTLRRGDLSATVDVTTGLLVGLTGPGHRRNLLADGAPVGELAVGIDGRVERFEDVTFAEDVSGAGPFPELVFRREGRSAGRIFVTYSLSVVHQAVRVSFSAEELPRPDPGMHAGLQTAFAPGLRPLVLRHDHPYGITPVSAERDHVRKYPSGHWMTSEQYFEDVRRPFTSSSLVDLTAEGAPAGLLVTHDGAQAWFRDQAGVRALLTMADPWDGDHWHEDLGTTFSLVPHAGLTDAERARLAVELYLEGSELAPLSEVDGGGELPRRYGALSVEGEDGDPRPGVLATALFRESAHAAKRLAGHLAESVRDPFVVRLVEYDGRATRVRVRLPGPVARAVRTNLLGEPVEELTPVECPAPWGPAARAAAAGLPDGPPDPWSAVTLALRPHEVATLYLDLERGRWIPRDLDRHRKVWATVHRRESV